MEEKEQLEFSLPNSKTIPCLNCKWGCMDYLGFRCPKYPDGKPAKVYYQSEECPEQEPLIK